MESNLNINTCRKLYKEILQVLDEPVVAEILKKLNSTKLITEVKEVREIIGANEMSKKSLTSPDLIDKILEIQKRNKRIIAHLMSKKESWQAKADMDLFLRDLYVVKQLDLVLKQEFGNKEIKFLTDMLSDDEDASKKDKVLDIQKKIAEQIKIELESVGIYTVYSDKENKYFVKVANKEQQEREQGENKRPETQDDEKDIDKAKELYEEVKRKFWDKKEEYVSKHNMDNVVKDYLYTLTSNFNKDMSLIKSNNIELSINRYGQGDYKEIVQEASKILKDILQDIGIKKAEYIGESSWSNYTIRFSAYGDEPEPEIMK